MKLNLLLLETSGNQSYIFSTNKLKENIGASELTYQSGTKWVLEAIEAILRASDITRQSRLSLWLNQSSQELRDKLKDPDLNPPIDQSPIEIILATSGKALILTQKRSDAQKIIEIVTHRALREAPGLDICGIISEEFDWNTAKISDINRTLHQQFETVRSHRPGTAFRFLRLPIVAECATSGLPANKIHDQADRSVVSIAKRQASQQGIDRIQQLLNQPVSGDRPDRLRRHYTLLDGIANFDSEFNSDASPETPNIDWLAVVHADGNGLGQIFLDFGQYTTSNRDYIDQYRTFSHAIDECTENAFLNALDAFAHRTVPQDGKYAIPIVPLILGGDDLTVVCDGRCALQFTHKFLQAFETETQNSLPIRAIAERVHQQGQLFNPNALANNRLLSACAGVAIVKKHFPFSIAYHLAEQLISSAKIVKKIVVDEQGNIIPCSSIDYHVLYDSSGVDYESIIQKLQLLNAHLYTKPYIVSEPTNLAEAQHQDWLTHRSWLTLESRIAALNAKDEEQRYLLPNSQMHDLRDGLFLGVTGADARYKLIRDRYATAGLTAFEGDDCSLFWEESLPLKTDDSLIKVTGLLDAMDAAGFWEGQS